jgi:hypothetical protein
MPPCVCVCVCVCVAKGPLLLVCALLLGFEALSRCCVPQTFSCSLPHTL